jgi:hypothetical protein
LLLGLRARWRLMSDCTAQAAPAWADGIAALAPAPRRVQ